jgi:hypothetical protein
VRDCGEETYKSSVGIRRGARHFPDFRNVHVRKMDDRRTDKLKKKEFKISTRRNDVRRERRPPWHKNHHVCDALLVVWNVPDIIGLNVLLFSFNYQELLRQLFLVRNGSTMLVQKGL